MSRDLVAASGITYTNVDFDRRNKKLPEGEGDRSDAIPLYAVIEKKGINEEKRSPATYTEVQRHNSLDVVMSKSLKSPELSGDKPKEWKSRWTTSWHCVAMILALLLLGIAISINAAVSYSMILRLRYDINNSHLQYVELHNKTLNIFSLIPDLSSNVSHIEDLIVIQNSKLVSTSQTLASLDEDIHLIANASFRNSIFSPAPSCQAIYLLQPYTSSGYFWVKSSSGSATCIL